MKNKLLVFVSLFILPLSLFAQSTIQTQLGNNIDFVVAKDGSGQYTTVQAAINAVPNNSTSANVIFVKKGTYTEKVEIPSTKTNLYLIGEDAATTIIQYGDYVGSTKTYSGIITSANGAVIGTSTSHTMYVASNDFTMMNITIKNTAGDVGQAVALNSKGDRHFLYHCKLIGYQDTYYTWGSGRFYIKDTYVEGAIDYIFGSGVALFDSCQIHSLRTNSYITAASTDQNFKFGYVFNNCKLTAASGISSVYMGRPWKAYAQTVFMNSELGSFMNAAGWYQWSSAPSNSNTCFYAEYKNCGAGSGTGSRVSWSSQLTATQAATYTKANLFDKTVNPTNYSANWAPNPEADAVYKVIKNNTTRFITSACFSTTPPPVTDCNGTTNGTAKLDICGRCIAGTTGKTACTSVGEAETDECSMDGVSETKNSGFSGSSYLNPNNAIGSAITFHVLAANAGTATLSFRYSNGGTADRPAQISLNNVTLANNLSFPVTTDFTTWKAVDLSVTLLKGINVVKLISTTAEGMANIDQIGYVSAGLSKGSCVITGLEEEMQNNQAVVFPNPANDYFQVHTNGEFDYRIYNLSGMEVENGKAVDMANVGNGLKAGIYVLKVKTSVSERTLKITKQ